jgi:hypothetical protein
VSAGRAHGRVDVGLFDGSGFDCSEHGPFRVADTVFREQKEHTRAQWENTLAIAKSNAAPGERPLIHSYDF